MAKTDDKLFDELLTKAFNEQYKKETAQTPKTGLDKLYPFKAEHMKDARSLSKKKKHKPIWMNHVAKAAAIALCVITAGFGILMTDEGIRGTVSDAVTHWVDEYISIDFTGARDKEKIDITKTDIGYIPQGYTLTDDRSDKDSVSHVYSNEKGEYIIIDILSSADIELMTDNRKHDVEKYNVNGYEGYISYSEDMKQGSVYFGNKHFTVAISGMIDKDELIKTAENIVIKG